MTNEKPYLLRAGSVRATFEPKTGFLRYLKVGEHEALRGIYAAVRDANWDTVLGVLEDVEINDQGDSFEVRFTSTHQKDDVHFVWQGRVTGEPSGRVTFTFEGEAKSTFRSNRVGFCVLHPMNAAGATCVIEHVAGTKTEGHFPKTISPHQPFKDARSIKHEVKAGLWAKVTMQGDTFETEDQRNWTDASFKTYCTPLEQPFPVTLQAGTKVEQSVTLELSGTVPDGMSSSQELRVTFDVNASSPLPHLGLGVARESLTQTQLEHLKTLNLSHLRLDLDLGEDYTPRLEQTTKEAGALNLGLELALHLSDNAEAELKRFKQVLDILAPPVARVLVFHKDEKCTRERWLELAREYLPNIPLAGGTDAFFTELNRERPPVTALDLVTYSLNPQVHAFDNASLVETLPAQAVTVESAATLSAGKPVVVSPITLKMRHNPNAAGDKSLSLEQQTDPRQTSLFGAVWTLGSLKYLTESSAASLTHFETTGPLGVMAAQEPNVYPMFHVFADVSEFRGGEVLASSSSHPLKVECLVLREGERLRLLLANMTGETQTVTVKDMNGTLGGRVLDGATAEGAALESKQFRSHFPLTFEADGDLSVTLNPYALLTLDGAA